MPTLVDPFSDEQARTLVNLAQRYQVWIEAERALRALPYNLSRKTIKGRDYLYEIVDRAGNGRSLGPWSAEQAKRLETFRSNKSEAKARRDGSRESLIETCRLYRALRLPMLPSEAGAILREADRRSLLGSHLLVVGTNALPAYSIEAAGFIRDVPEETQDFDLAWSSAALVENTQPIWDLLKAVDPTYAINTERPFQARNAKAYEVEILAAPSRVGSIFRTDRPMPAALPEQEWLLEGRLVDHVVISRDGLPARIVAPDPRWYALQKLWLADQPKRNPLKREKDRKQGRAILDAVSLAMPQFPLDRAFVASLPEELAGPFEQWAVDRPAPRPLRW